MFHVGAVAFDKIGFRTFPVISEFLRQWETGGTGRGIERIPAIRPRETRLKSNFVFDKLLRPLFPHFMTKSKPSFVSVLDEPATQALNFRYMRFFFKGNFLSNLMRNC